MIAAVLAAAAIAWTSPHALSTADGRSLVPELAENGSGGAVAVWDHETGPTCVEAPDALSCVHTVEAVSRLRTGDPWGSPVALARPGVGATPRVAVNDAGKAAVIWVHDIGRDRVLQATYRTGPTADFPNPNDLSAAVLEVRSHRVALDTAGNVIVVWAQRQAASFQVAAEVRDARSGVWGAPVALSQRGVTSGPSVAVTPAGEAVVVWMEENVVRAAIGDITKDVWEPTVTISRLFGEAGGEPAVAVNAAGDAEAAWTWHDRPRGQGIVQAAFRPAGGEWSAAQDLGNGFGLSADPDVVLDPRGNALAVWIADNRALQSASAIRGSPWSRVTTVAGGLGAHPEVAVADAGDGVVTWRDVGEGSVLTSARPVEAGAWQPAVVLSNAEAATPHVAVDAGGTGTALWTSGPAASVRVETAELVGDWRPWLANVQPPRVRGRARVGRVVACDRGRWEGTVPISYAYRWLRRGRVIPAATRSTYRLRKRDAGAVIACRVTAANAARELSLTSRAVHVAQ